MNYHSDDALDNALFSLELEEPPADLRASILAATAFRPAPMFSLYEIAGLSALLAIVIALISIVVASGGAAFAQAVLAIEVALTRTLSSYTTLAWIAAGGATAIWLSLFTGFQSYAVASRKGTPTPKR